MMKLFIPASLLMLSACSGITQPQGEQSNPIEKTWELPYDLIEVSGLSATEEEDVVAMVQDEDGVLFFYDLASSEVIGDFEFGKHGDYEGVEKVGDDYWVLRSDGTLFQVKNVGTESQETIKHKTPLSEQNDCEGLGYDTNKGILLIACKGNPGLSGKSKKKRKAIYAFDLTTNELIEEPITLIKQKDLEEFYGGYLPFEPSAVAVDQVENQLIVLSSVGKTMVKVKYDGTIVDITELDEYDFEQPEGVILRKSKLLISNEGKQSEAKLVLYENNK